jgi:DNA mismatch endonuclease (patch repair protein)
MDLFRVGRFHPDPGSSAQRAHFHSLFLPLTLGWAELSRDAGMDTLSKAERSALMARVKNKNSTPEVMVRSLLHNLGYRFRIHRRDLPGTPDVYLPKYRAAVFVHGCFWHGHNCKRGKLPKTREEFWRRKQEANRRRDDAARRNLQELGIRTILVWECELKDTQTLASRLSADLGAKSAE